MPEDFNIIKYGWIFDILILWGIEMKRNLITITSRMISLLMIINLLTGIGGVSAAVIRD